MRLRKRRQCFPSCSSLHRVDEDEVYWRRKKGGEELEWPHNSTHLLSQLAQCFTNAMVGPKSWLGGLFNRFGNRRNEKFLGYTLTPIQEQRLHRLQERLHIPFDETRPDHQKALIKLWHIAFPNVVLTGLISEQWKDMGWQGPNPSTDFRGCGFISLENLLFFGQNFPVIIEGRWRQSNLGIPIRRCWHQCIFYVDSDVGFIFRKTKKSTRIKFPETIRRR
uniref:ELMO domain-containing protein n=1 Tax=Gossypium raimondii TaxID=29730 RepID=A0A0D2T121_GOSRA|nr:hypothetical protein B456_008G153300 [Gossypium raimondii]